VDGAINRAGGQGLVEARERLGGCPTGQAKRTDSFGLTGVNHIIHAVGPVMRSGSQLEFSLLASAYTSALVIGRSLSLSSMAFCLISAGSFRGGTPLGDVITAGLRAIIGGAFAGLVEVYVVAFTDDEELMLRSSGAALAAELRLQADCAPPTGKPAGPAERPANISFHTSRPSSLNGATSSSSTASASMAPPSSCPPDSDTLDDACAARAEAVDDWDKFDPRGPDAPGNEIDSGHDPPAGLPPGIAQLFAEGRPVRVEGRLRERLEVWRRSTRNQAILDLVEHGHRIPFIGGVQPEPHHDASNFVEDQDLLWGDAQIEAMLRSGAIGRWSDLAAAHGGGAQPHCVSPVLIHEKPSSTPEARKLRFIHNLKWVNLHVADTRYTMESVAGFMKQLEPGDYIWSIDLSNAYFHVSVHPDFVKFLGFRWRGAYYCFLVLPFGLKSSAAAFMSVASVPARLLRERRLVSALLWYMDDYVGSVGQNPDDYSNVAAAVKIFLDLGFDYNMDKLELELSNVRQALGFILDTRRMVVSLTPRRQEKMRLAVDHCLSNRSSVTARAVARVVGHTMSGSLVFGLWARLLSSYLMHWVAERVKAVGNDAPLELSGRALGEMTRWADATRVAAERPLHFHARAPTWALRCDVSDAFISCRVLRAPPGAWDGRAIVRELTTSERQRSETLRALAGYRHACHTLAGLGRLRPGDILEIASDSKCAVAAFRKGGSQLGYDVEADELPILESMLDIFSFAEQSRFEARARWVHRPGPGTSGPRGQPPDRCDFGIRPDSLHDVARRLGWNRVGLFGEGWVDRFAAPHNAVCRYFVSKFHSLAPGAIGTDAFSTDWSQGTSYVLPDFGLIDQVLDHIECYDAVTLCVVPRWPSKHWWWRLSSGPWRARIVASLELPGSCLIAHAENAEHCFFGAAFTQGLMAFRTRKMRPAP
jgi:O-acetyl-ADP-ribose deacetylase (regulator of RNase III)